MIEREIISIQNIDFRDVAKNENFDVNVANDVNIVIIAFDVEKNVDIDANIAFDVSFKSSLDEILTSFVFDVKNEIIDANIAMNVNIASSFSLSSANFFSICNCFARFLIKRAFFARFLT